MKHLNRFNESIIDPKPKEIDTEYIDMCFVNFLDAGSKTKKEGILYKIKIKLRGKHSNWEPYNIKDYVELAKKLEQVTLEVEDCLNKVKIEYPNIEYSVYIDNKNDKFVVVFVLKGTMTDPMTAHQQR